MKIKNKGYSLLSFFTKMTSKNHFFSARSIWWRPIDDETASWKSNLLSFVVLTIVSFAMLWLGDKLNSQGVAITRYMATTQAPITGRFYPESSRHDITVLVYDDLFLNENGYAWPMSYQDHADWLERLASDPNAKPKAVFIDITFTQERVDQGLEALQTILCKLNNELEIPVFLAALTSPSTGQLYLRPDLQATTDSNGKACFTMVGVDSLEDPIDRQTWVYPLTTSIQSPSGVIADGFPTSYRSAALAISEDAANLSLEPEDFPLALVWGATTDLRTDLPSFLQGCREGPRDITFAAPDILIELFSNEPIPAICPFHTTLSMLQVGSMEESELHNFIADRYLLIGAAINGQNDLAYSPVHGLVPGVHVHAMALDNLLTYKSKYKQQSEWRFPPSYPMFISGMVAIAVVFIVHLVFRKLRSGLRRNNWVRRHFYFLVMTPDERQATTFIVRFLTAPLLIIIWLIRLSIQAIAVMLLIAFMQWQFRIGMLPVIELASMTILAEGFSYMDRVRAFLFGDQVHQSTPPHSSLD